MARATPALERGRVPRLCSVVVAPVTVVAAPGFRAIGHVTLDRFGDEVRLGGGALYAAITAHRLGRGVAILTSHGADFPLDGGPSSVEGGGRGVRPCRGIGWGGGWRFSRAMARTFRWMGCRPRSRW